MAKKMLIDATHPEETRVVVVSGNRVEEFDFETATKKQLKGNIYLAKVTRVEPSLQAAFVEYGGNRHGFLAFSEIHPDYYQIPHEDRLALMREEAERDEEEDDDDEDERERRRPAAEAEEPHEDALVSDELSSDTQHAAEDALFSGSITEDAPPAYSPTDENPESLFEAQQAADEGEPSRALAEESGLEPITISTEEQLSRQSGDEREELPAGEENVVETVEAPASESAPEEIGAQDAMEELPRRKRRPVRRYKIQEVIRRRQILLVQVVKEERGNKGAALTTFLSLAGRYCVLMPNTDRGGGISRKITSGADRKRLKDIAVDLEVPEGMGLIVRTAGANRTKPELKRDFEYLLRLWESVRELTLKSTAPALVYEEGNLVKRSIRDLYGRDIDGVLVEGAEAYKEAKAFMKMLTPSHAKNVQQYTDKLPLFQRYQVETQLDSLYSPTVELRSGGYIVMNATEALVAIDVNSGKATREHSIEETALKTNLEAAEEVARQLRLRDLAGLIVIDFIDMEEHRHDRMVERKLKDCLKSDRARIQIGRISPFGLLEMSRQRLRASVIEGSTLICEHCDGAGRVPSVETTALRILRAIEEEGMRGRMDGAQVKAPPDVALYLLNYKRPVLRQIEERFGLPCYIEASPEMHAGRFVLERAPEGLIDWRPEKSVISPDSGFFDESTAEPAAADIDEVEAEAEEANVQDGPQEIRVRDESPVEREGGEGRRGRRRRRRGRRGDERDTRQPRENRGAQASNEEELTSGGDGLRREESSAEPVAYSPGNGEEGERKRRRRGRRGGRRNRRRDRDGLEHTAAQADSSWPGTQDENPPTTDDLGMPTTENSIRVESGSDVESYERPSEAASNDHETAVSESYEKTAVAPQNGHGTETPAAEESEPAAAPSVESETDATQPRRKGWWQRKIFG